MVAVAAVAALVGGCGMGERRAAAERIVESWEAARAKGTARFSLVARTKMAVDRPQGPEDPAATGEAAVEGLADLGRDRFVAMAPFATGGPPVPVVIADGTTLYARRVGPSQAQAQGRAQAQTATRRSWARLDFGALDPDEIDNSLPVMEAAARLRTANRAVNPFMLLPLLEGALSGSVERIGTEDVRGVATTRYKANVDWEKATKDDDEEVAEATEALLKSLFVRGVILPAHVWLDDDGLPRRFSLTVRSSVERRRIADQTLVFELFDFGAPVDVAVPPPDQVVRVNGMGSLVQAVDPEAAS